MARTPLFGLLQRTMRAHGPSGLRALSRRQFLVMSAALAACSGRGGAQRDIAIVGGGVAGLTAAYRLSKAGQSVTLYEASDRLGGRMFTRRDFNEDGQFCELGGELVDTGHTALRTLAGELGVEIQPIAPQNGEDFYFFDGRLRTQRDMIDPATGRGAYAQLAARIAQDQNALLDADENWTQAARDLDATPLRAYLERVSNLAPAWAMDVLDVAYRGEYGLPTGEQSALNLVDFIGTDVQHGFQVFGDSDEAFRIAGGSSSLPEAIAAQLGGVAQRMRHALVAVARTNSGVRLSFEGPDGRVEREHTHLILATPFTKLRSVEGLDGVGLGDEKLRAIRELGYGDNSKLMVSMRTRPWASAHWPAPTAGVFYTDRAQLIWETSRAQDGAHGILTNFLQGQQDRAAALADLRRGLGGMSPESAAALDETKIAFMAWARQPFALGSYSTTRVGQYTTLLEHTATPSDDGRIRFAGEHTSTDFMGFMNGAVESGERAAAELLA
jgi:monoamine oxidase